MNGLKIRPVLGVAYHYPYDILYDYSLLDPLATGLGYAAFVTSAASLVTDTRSLIHFPEP